MDKELNALRRVAKAAQLYQASMCQKQRRESLFASESKETSAVVLELGPAEFELADALNEWYRTRREPD